MTDFNKIENYYKQFDEWNRTFTPEGMFEFENILISQLLNTQFL